MRNAKNGTGLTGILDLPFHVYRLTAGLFVVRNHPQTGIEISSNSPDAFNTERNGAHDGSPILRDSLRGPERVSSRGA